MSIEGAVSALHEEAAPAATARLSREQLLAFAPDPERGRILYREVKRRVIQSLREVAAASRGVAEFDEAGFGSRLDEFESAEHAPVRLFAIYYDLLNAIDRDDVDAASEMFGELGARAWACGDAAYRNFTDQDLGNTARYRRLINGDPENPVQMCALNGDEYERITKIAEEGLALLEAGAPEVAGEIRALVAEVVFAKGEAGEGMAFHGVSSFLLWGALFLNAEGHRTPLEVVQTLVHESGHLHLFGVAVDEPLVLNPDEERYPSPLRKDPRPMDGVYHATYVGARMHYALARLLESGVLDAEQRQQAAAALRDHADTFRNGMAIVEAYGRLTGLGSELLARAREYMAGAETTLAANAVTAS